MKGMPRRDAEDEAGAAVAEIVVGLGLAPAGHALAVDEVDLLVERELL
jgi:hypothetical protein